MTNISIKIEGRDGALTRFRVVGAAALRGDAPVYVMVDGDDLVGSASKKDVRSTQEWVDQMNTLATRPTTTAASGSRRVLVEAGTVKVGEDLPQGRVTGLGRIWLANADTASVHGVSPAAEYVQYAYFG